MHRLVHADNATGPKLAMVPTSTGQALFAEYIDYGVHVYELNSNIGHGAGPMKTLGFLSTGQSLTYAGVKFDVSTADSSGVYISVTR